MRGDDRSGLPDRQRPPRDEDRQGDQAEDHSRVPRAGQVPQEGGTGVGRGRRRRRRRRQLEYDIYVSTYLVPSLQGDQAACSQPSVPTKTKVLF